MVKFFGLMIGGVLVGGVVALWAQAPLLGGAVAGSAVIAAATNFKRWIATAK